MPAVKRPVLQNVRRLPKKKKIEVHADAYHGQGKKCRKEEGKMKKKVEYDAAMPRDMNESIAASTTQRDTSSL